MAAIQIDGLSKVYGNGVVAVRDVHLDVADGEFLVLVGPSGCGKSTLLRMIAGLEEVTAGELRIDGREITDAQPRDRDIAMVFQSYALYPHMTVRRNIAYPLKLAGVSAEEMDARVAEAARLLQLEAVLDRKPGQLSGGQRQRVAMGRAIVRKPAAFLMDEPLSNLDAKLRVQMRAEIARIQRDAATTTIYVTHDQVEAMTMGDRVAVLNGGQVEQCDTPRRLYDRPANLFVAAFIGSPPMNFLKGQMVPEGGTVAFAEEGGDGKAPLRPAPEHAARLRGFAGKSVVLGLRPEHIALAAPGDPSPARLPATVQIVEPMGAETLVYLTTGRHKIVARVPPTERVAAGQTVTLALDLGKARFFDAETGQAVG